jgi:hypothetical protein
MKDPRGIVEMAIDDAALSIAPLKTSLQRHETIVGNGIADVAPG